MIKHKKDKIKRLNEQSDDKRNKARIVDPSENEDKQEYVVGDICMVSQTNNFLQFYTVHITKILGNTLLVQYLNTNKKTTFT